MHARIRLGRHPERGHYDFATIAGILDEGTVCNVGFVVNAQPIVLPTIYGRIERSLYIHGSALARWMHGLIGEAPLCVTVSILDGLVLARSAYQHSLNYRSVIVLGRAEPVDDGAEKLAALRAMVEHVCRGRWDDVRGPADNELQATQVLRVDITTASAKIRTGPPLDFDKDLGTGVWAGVIPTRIVRGEPIPDPNLEEGVPVPAYAR
jgi:nitroimidazol reductase NimA-like FMN-containing flavoprotein (pyridoxamine 5'-phosphate oxidase superfamily)